MGESMSAERRKKISESLIKANKTQKVFEARSKAMQKRARKDLSNPARMDPTHKRCTKCKEWKLLAEFSIRRIKLKTGVTTVYPEASCKACKNRRNRENYERRRETGEQREVEQRIRENRTPEQKARRRQTAREYETAQRRAAGIKPRNFSKPRDERSTVPVEPIAPLIEVLEEQGLNQKEISIQSGVLERRIYAIRNFETPTVSLEVVDRLLLAFGMQEALEDLYPLDPEKEDVVAYQVIDPNGVLKRDD